MVHLWLVVKHVVDFLLVLTELFSPALTVEVLYIIERVVQLFAPPTNPAMHLCEKFLLQLWEKPFYRSTICVQILRFSRVRIKVRSSVSCYFTKLHQFVLKAPSSD